VGKGKLKLSLCWTNWALRHEGVWGSEYTDLLLLTSALLGGEWSTSRLGRFTPGECAPGTHWIGGWVDLRAGLHDVEKKKLLTLPGLKLRLLGHPVRSQSLYRLSYPGSSLQYRTVKKHSRNIWTWLRTTLCKMELKVFGTVRSASLSCQWPSHKPSNSRTGEDACMSGSGRTLIQHCSWISLECLKRILSHLRQYSRCSGRD
jgi:hypothetical protein